ncbi:GDSL-type esterase/lipase family protein [Parabacteroides sp. FAFU027]|uniref:GDSL-type esterase/lipase family protein n=1 Tax=Parabacteroides sp. FAFU027 TaxID=2922715 RepID=UPI001FAF22F3|nr:GDSL-type esterase/lipase family protein [Parabacteroides sp. FAFU027]
MKSRIFTAFLLVAFCCNLLYAQLTIHTIGDSTMEQKSTDSTSNPNGQRGWAQMLTQFVVNGAVVNDRAKSGTSSKTFYEDKDSYGNYRFWATVKPQIKSGDYVIIQFGHNDEKDAGWQSAHYGVAYTGIGTNPWEQYTQYLIKYVNEVRALGATPILFTPIVRNGFTGSTMTATACHNIGTDSIGRPLDYPAAMRKVASDMNVALVDHTLLTKAYCESIGQSQTTSLIYNVGDGTHLGIFGATTYARLAVKELIRQGILANYLNANPDILVSPTGLSYGKCYVNASSVSQLSLSGTDLTPESGTLTVTAPNGYTLSTSQNGTYSQTLQFNYTLGTINLTNFYVKFKPSVEGNYNDSIVLTNGVKTKKISVTGQCITLTGQNASAYWELSAAPGAAVSQGPINVIPETYSNMALQSYAAPGSTATWSGATTSWTGVALTSTTKNQRNLIANSNPAGTWPAGDIDIVNNRFMQFGVTAIEGTVFDIDSIGLYGGGAGGSGMRFKVYISKDSLFSDPNSTVMIGDRGTVANTSNQMYPVTYNKLVELTAGQSLYLRVYPWYTSSASGKTICLYGVLIKGVVSTSPMAVNAFKTDNRNISCFPAQTTGKTTLQYGLSNTSDVNISLMTIDGRILKTIRKSNQAPDMYREELDLSAFPSGIYLCSVISENHIQTIRIIKK